MIEVFEMVGSEFISVGKIDKRDMKVGQCCFEEKEDGSKFWMKKVKHEVKNDALFVRFESVL